MPDRQATTDSAPRASRPHIPGYGIKLETEGSGLLPWSWAEERLQSSHNYWLTTASSVARPHVMIVWGLWLKGAFCFTTGKLTRKGKNLAVNPQCVVCTENSAEAVIVEGEVSINRDAELRALYDHEYETKYHWNMEPYAAEPMYIVRPLRAFALREKDFQDSATRWMWG